MGYLENESLNWSEKRVFLGTLIDFYLKFFYYLF